MCMCLFLSLNQFFIFRPQRIYFARAKYFTRSSRPLAMMLSLPSAFTLWGMSWFIFGIVSYAYKPGLANIPAVLNSALRVMVMLLVCSLMVLGVVAIFFFYRIWHPIPTSKHEEHNSQPEGDVVRWCFGRRQPRFPVSPGAEVNIGIMPQSPTPDNLNFSVKPYERPTHSIAMTNTSYTSSAGPTPPIKAVNLKPTTA